nr:MAG TPA: hypothetical protein [Caudoviricetes sp.]
MHFFLFFYFTLSFFIFAHHFLFSIFLNFLFFR